MPADADADDVAVLAIGFDEIVEIGLVGALDLTAVDLLCVPQVAEAAEAFAERAGVAGRITEGEEDNLGLFVGERAESDFPDLGRNA